MREYGDDKHVTVLVSMLEQCTTLEGTPPVPCLTIKAASPDIEARVLNTKVKRSSDGVGFKVVDTSRPIRILSIQKHGKVFFFLPENKTPQVSTLGTPQPPPLYARQPGAPPPLYARQPGGPPPLYARQPGAPPPLYVRLGHHHPCMPDSLGHHHPCMSDWGTTTPVCQTAWGTTTPVCQSLGHNLCMPDG